MKKLAVFALAAMLSGFAGAWVFSLTQKKDTITFSEGFDNTATQVSYKGAALNQSDFVKASEVATPAVVFIKTTSNMNQRRSLWDDWFGWDPFGSMGPVSSSGSGVIISNDGYIVTNNHVIDGADEIEVVLNNNKRNFKAKVIGADPSTDLAVLKIEGKNLPKINFGNSENLKTGEWVVAVGNPFNLTSTVTAGIVSAKGRNINIVNNQFPIESFIQTDAAINPGNSGGALVNVSGELVGINTAIVSKTGSYNGYGFAIPSNIVAKIVKDMIDFGDVQRAFTGMDVSDIDGDLYEKLKQDNGVYVNVLQTDGPADKAGVKEGDVIMKVNGKTVNSKAEFDEQIAYHRPGDKVKLIVDRKGTEKEYSLTLTNRDGNTEVTKKESITSTILGADFEPISKLEREKYKVKGGYRVSSIRSGRIRNMGIPEGFIFVALNKVEYTDVTTFIKDFERVKGQVTIEGIHPNGSRGFYSFFYY
ncbi:MAG: PDZ domain-containing protein [Bacteroidetes bacterium]|nr:MAG: PDZ domain-containing protein [Bacteroidota bacterium]